MSNQMKKPSPEGLAAAQQELEVLDVMARSVTAAIASLSKKPQSLGYLDHNELALVDNRHGQLKAFHELAHRVYGRTVIGKEVDENDRPKGDFVIELRKPMLGW